MEISKGIDINDLKIELQKKELSKLKSPSLNFRIAEDLLFKIIESSTKFNNGLHILKIKDKSLTARITSLTIMEGYEGGIIEFYFNKEDFSNSRKISVNLKGKIRVDGANIEEKGALDILNLISNQIEEYNNYIEMKNKPLTHTHNEKINYEKGRTKRNIEKLKSSLL